MSDVLSDTWFQFFFSDSAPVLISGLASKILGGPVISVAETG